LVVFRAQEHFKVIIKTPVVGYEEITAHYDVLDDGSRRLIIDRSKVRITTLVIKTEIRCRSSMTNAS
jgi:hypothetical protein